LHIYVGDWVIFTLAVRQPANENGCGPSPETFRRPRIE